MTQNTGENWGSLLAVLTEEELGQYAGVADDQIAREVRWHWLHAALVAGAIGAMGWTCVKWLFSGLETNKALWGLVLSGAMAYWPYRSVKTQRLWKGHRMAVDDELARRRQVAAGGS